MAGVAKSSRVEMIMSEQDKADLLRVLVGMAIGAGLMTVIKWVMVG